MRRRRPAGFTLGLVTALALVLPVAASAHAPTAYYPHRWDLFPLRLPGVAPSVALTQAPSVDEAAVALIAQAAKPWTEVGAAYAFRDHGPDPVEPGEDVCNPRIPGPIGKGPIDGPEGVLAVTSVCSFQGQVFYFDIVYDDAEAWWFGPARDILADRFDLVSVLAHEFGHATGFALHFEPGRDPECQDPLDHHTMCGAILPGNALPRTLEAHDAHTFAAVYD